MHDNTTDVHPVFLSVDQAAARSGLGRTKFRELVKAGNIRTARVGDRILIRPRDLEAWAESLVAAA